MEKFYLLDMQVDKYGTQMPIALLKLLLEKDGFYDQQGDLEWKTLKDVYYICAMGKSGGGRNPVKLSISYIFNFYRRSIFFN
jgi:dynein heavy chain, axonemal